MFYFVDNFVEEFLSDIWWELFCRKFFVYLVQFEICQGEIFTIF